MLLKVMLILGLILLGTWQVGYIPPKTGTLRMTNGKTRHRSGTWTSPRQLPR